MEKKNWQDWDIQRTFSALVISFQLYNKAMVMVTAPAGCSWPQVFAVMPQLNTLVVMVIAAPFTAKAAFLQPVQDKEMESKESFCCSYQIAAPGNDYFALCLYLLYTLLT